MGIAVGVIGGIIVVILAVFGTRKYLKNKKPKDSLDPVKITEEGRKEQGPHGGSDWAAVAELLGNLPEVTPGQNPGTPGTNSAPHNTVP